MEWAELALGATLSEGFARLAWALGPVVVAVIGFILYGKGGKKRLAEQDRKIAELEKRAVQVNINVGDAKQPTARRTLPGAMFHVAERRPDEDVARVGTVSGPMTVRLGNHEKTLEDIVRILRKNEVLASLSDEYEGREE